MFNAIKGTLELPNINIIADEVDEIDDVNIKDFLAPYRPEKVDIEKIVSKIGETAKFSSILQASFSDKKDGGKDVLNSILPSGRTFSQLIEGIPDDKRVDVAELAARLVSNEEEQVSTRETLKALGIRFETSTPNIPDINELMPSRIVPINVETFKASLPAGNVLDAVQDTIGNINLNSMASEAKKIDVSLNDFLAPYRPEKAINLEDLTSKIGKTATISDILRETIRGTAKAHDIVRRVTPPGEVLERLLEGIPEDKRIDVSQFGSKLIPDSGNKEKQVDTRQALESLGLKFEEPSSNFPATIEGIRDRFVPSSNVLSAVKDTLGFSREDPIAAEVSEIKNVNIRGFLAPYRPEKVDVKQVLSTVGYTATFATIVKAAFPGKANGKEVLRRILPGGKTLTQLLEGIPDDKQIDISQFATKLAPKSEKQIDTLQTLEALGANLSKTDGIGSSGVFFDPFDTNAKVDRVKVPTFLTSIERITGEKIDGSIANLVDDKDIDIRDIAAFSTGPTVESLTESGLVDQSGNLAKTATLERLLRGLAPGSVDLKQLIAGVLPRNEGISPRTLVASLPGGTVSDISQTMTSLITNSQSEANTVATFNALYAQAPVLPEDPSLFRAIFLTTGGEGLGWLLRTREGSSNTFLPDTEALQSFEGKTEFLVASEDPNNPISNKIELGPQGGVISTGKFGDQVTDNTGVINIISPGSGPNVVNVNRGYGLPQGGFITSSGTFVSEARAAQVFREPDDRSGLGDFYRVSTTTVILDEEPSADPITGELRGTDINFLDDNDPINLFGLQVPPYRRGFGAEFTTVLNATPFTTIRLEGGEGDYRLTTIEDPRGEIGTLISKVGGRGFQIGLPSGGGSQGNADVPLPDSRTDVGFLSGIDLIKNPSAVAIEYF